MPVPAAIRLPLGLVSVALMGAGIVLIVRGDEVTGGVLIRVGLLAGSAWLVAPLVRRPGAATLAFLAAGALVLVRPRLIVAVAVAAIMWRTSRRRRRAVPEHDPPPGDAGPSPPA